MNWSLWSFYDLDFRSQFRHLPKYVYFEFDNVCINDVKTYPKIIFCKEISTAF